MKRRITILLFIIAICTYSCDYDYMEVNGNKVFKNKNILLKEEPMIKYFSVCENYGAPVNDVCFLVIQKGTKYYKFNPKFRFFLSKDSIFLFQTISLNYSEKGNWVLIDKKNKNGESSVYFHYDSIPQINTTITMKGVFHLVNGEVLKIGELTDYKSLHDLPDVGFYYLSSPGMFYDKVLSIHELK